MKKEETVSISKVNLWQGAAAVLAILLAVSVYTGGFSGNESTGAVIKQAEVAAKQAAPPSNPTPTVPAVSLNAVDLMDDDAVLGDPNAPLTIIEWSDYQCPFCRRFWSDTLPQLKKEYIDTGKVKLVFRDFPLSFHQGAGPAAEGAECARDQKGDDMYYEFHDKIFEEQMKQGTGTVQFGATDVKSWAKDLDLDSAEFDSCLDSGKFKSEVQADFVAGQNAGIKGTPGFIVGNQPLSGAQPFSAFKAVIDAQLN